MNTRFTAIAFLAAAMLFLFFGLASARDMTADETWSGTVRVAGTVVVEKGVRLTILPGTRVMFEKGPPCEEGIADTGLFVKGTLVADGTPDARIVFTSGADEPAIGDWGEVKLYESSGSSISYCDFGFGGWGLHMHDTELAIKDCSFRDNSVGGLRGKGGNVEITGCRLDGLGIGVRYWQGAPSIHHNDFIGCGTAIFCRQECDGTIIRDNNIVASTEYSIKLGDGQKADIDASGNWWGTTDVSKIREKIFDHGREDYIGRVVVEPVLRQRADTCTPIASSKDGDTRCICSH
ncbi:MAG: right-handed parallel beta-helix repeat-containing protein [Nitrospirae bacterium]|nr:right-handed parallel beta-helix repeat-containing protein [Nitrospirota bacterium]